MQVVISTIGLLFVKKLEEQPLWGSKGVLEVHFYGELFDLDHVFVTATALYYRLHVSIVMCPLLICAVLSCSFLMGAFAPYSFPFYCIVKLH